MWNINYQFSNGIKIAYSKTLSGLITNERKF